MSDIQQFRLPDAGEGLTEAEIVSWKVRPGDTVAINDTLVEIETAKSLVELPSPFAGVVTELLVGEGQTVPVGTPIIAVRTQGAAAEPAPAADHAPAADPAPQAEPAPRAAERGEARTSVLVGYGPRPAGAVARRPRRGVSAGRSTGAPGGRANGPSPERSGAPGPALAKPPVRKLARDLGVDLADLTPTGLGGVVTREDVAAAASPDARAAPAVGTRPAEEAVETVRGVRKATARAMVASAFTAPHVTEWVDVDVSRTRRLVQRLRDDPAFEGVTVSPLLLVAKAVLVGVARHPGVNASWIEGTGGDPSRIVRHRAVNLGIAAATPRGLVVPNIKDAHLLGLADLASRLSALTAAARQGRTTPADLTAGTITVTNVGIFGVDGGTPILNPGEAAILAVGRMVQRPWVHRGRVRPRWVMHLSLSFDHRLVDGDLGSRFLADVAAVLEDPVRALVWS